MFLLEHSMCIASAKRLTTTASLRRLVGKEETTLYDVWTLINCQSQRKIDLLLTDGTPNFFYIRDSAGVIWAVDAVWGGAGWEIGASPLQDSRPWGRGRQVILRRP